MATSTANPLAPHHLPAFITAPGETDWLFNVMVVVVVAGIVLVGVFYFRLHALPEHKAHTGQKFQYDLVAILALLSLFTHNHIFWIAGLLLAFIPIPDFLSPVNGMARSLATIAKAVPPGPAVEPEEIEPLQIEPEEIDTVPLAPIDKKAGVRRIDKERAHG
jgi:hypothetical protein